MTATTPVIITVAITGAVPSKADNPAVPIAPSEQIESTHAAFEAGASLVHLHVRDDVGASSSDPDRFARVQEGIREHCPGMIIQFSTGGRGRAQQERAAALYLKPDMASLATGSVNFAHQIYENHPSLVIGMAETMREYGVKPEIEVFDLAMLYATERLVAQELVAPPPHVQFVLGIPNALPARRRLLEFAVAELQDLMPGGTWTAAGIGRHQLEVAGWALDLGGHVRTGLEDNLKYDRGRLARSNAELVTQVADLAAKFGRRPASCAEARGVLHLTPAA